LSDTRTVQTIGDSTPLLSVQNLGRRLSGHWLWRGVSFDLQPGDWLGLVAPSGAGKTLLLRMVALLDPLHEGRLILAGKDVSQRSLTNYRTQVMYLAQRATAFGGTVQDNLQRVFTLAAYRHRRYDPQQVMQWLDNLGRGEAFLERPAAHLSGGELQILAMVRSLQLNPKILLLDEPTASLDLETAEQVESLIQHWLKQGDRACIFTSHDSVQLQRVINCQLLLDQFLVHS
jgi:putative ABC transport system ATP-binding protein